VTAITFNHLCKIISTSKTGPTVSRADVVKYFKRWIKLPFASFGTDLYNLPYLKKLLTEADSKINIYVPISTYPIGGETIESKTAEIEWAISHGATELDCFLNRSATKSGDWNFVKKEIEEIMNAAKGRIVKIWVEFNHLKPSEILQVAELSIDGGAHFIRAGVGFGQVQRYSDIKLVKDVFGDKIKIEVGGGVRDAIIALNYLKAGMDRFACSTPENIARTLEDAQNRLWKNEVEQLYKRIDFIIKTDPSRKRVEA